VTGPTAESNRNGIKEIIKKALDWERRSGATFEAEKTAIIHFTWKAYKSDAEHFAIREQLVRPKTQVKILGMIMDAGLKYKEHIARAATKGLKAAMELQRLRGSYSEDSETAIHSHGGPGGGLCFKCMDARMQV
jgi:hypothetical protein